MNKVAHYDTSNTTDEWVYFIDISESIENTHDGERVVFNEERIRRGQIISSPNICGITHYSISTIDGIFTVPAQLASKSIVYLAEVIKLEYIEASHSEDWHLILAKKSQAIESYYR